MKEFLAGIFAPQELTNGAKEGLPYWIFWLLLCIIFLLIAFIFLRDKDLRRRVDSFLMGMKKKVIKMRLQASLKKENKKKESLLAELGEKAWKKKLRIEFGENLQKKLDSLERAKTQLAKERVEIESKITFLKGELEGYQKRCEQEYNGWKAKKIPYHEKIVEAAAEEKKTKTQIHRKQVELKTTIKKLSKAKEEIHSLQKEADLPASNKNSPKPPVDDRISTLEHQRKHIDNAIQIHREKRICQEREMEKLREKLDQYNEKLKETEKNKKDEIRRFNVEIKEWEKTRERVYEKTKTIEEQMKPLLADFGHIVNKERVDYKELMLFYSKIERAAKKTKDLENQIKKLE